MSSCLPPGNCAVTLLVVAFHVALMPSNVVKAMETHACKNSRERLCDFTRIEALSMPKLASEISTTAFRPSKIEKEKGPGVLMREHIIRNMNS